jgi:hypothetical protein
VILRAFSLGVATTCAVDLVVIAAVTVPVPEALVLTLLVGLPLALIAAAVSR